MRASKRTGRKLVIDLYTAVVLHATGNARIPQSDWQDVVLFVPKYQRKQIARNKWFDLLEQHSSERIFERHVKRAPKKYTLLFRPLYQENLDEANCLAGAAFIFSQWSGYWDRGEYEDTEKWLKSHGITKQSIHTSGHASPMDLKRFVKALTPQKVVPIHTFKPEDYEKMYPNVEIHRDGEWWKI
jgi:ribonuclease J